MPHIDDIKIKELELTANKIRQSIIAMLAEAGSGHTAGPLGMTDVFTAFYFHILNHRPHEPGWADRDRLFLSNGHICPVLYATMAHAGYLPIEELKTLRKFGSRLQGHPEREVLPGLESTSGPLGSGLSQAAGYAYALRMDAISYKLKAISSPRVYCLMSDGEQEEGNTWEAAMFAGHYKLANLTGIVDRNNIQIDGKVENIMGLEPFKAKYEAFNWHVIEINAHNFTDIIDAVETAKEITAKPTLIIANTIPGKGIASIEGDYLWHGKPPTREEAQHFLKELRSAYDKI